MSGTISTTDYEAILDDIGALLRVLGLGDHARPASSHNVFLDEILPAVESLRAQLAEAQVENGRLREKHAAAVEVADALNEAARGSQFLTSTLRMDLALARYRTQRDTQGETNG